MKKTAANRVRVLIQSLVIACSMYSRLPLPCMEWTKEGMRYALCFFPLVGVAVGAAEWGFVRLAAAAKLGSLARACVGTALPILLTGGIHMDGFLDTEDARNSFDDREKRLEILKDPHIGAFAVIGAGVYLLFYAAVFSELPDSAFPASGAVYVLTRALSGLSVVCFPKAKKDGLASMFSEEADRRTVCRTLGVWAAAAAGWLAVFLSLRAAVLSVLLALLLWGYYYRTAKRDFGGVTGDLAGWFLQVCELGLLFALAAGERLGWF